MNKIKIAQVITRLDWGGSPDIVRIICNNLNAEIYDVRLITGPTRYPSAKTKEFLREFNPKIVTIPQLQREINPINDLIALLRLYFLFRREKFDIVHTHTAKAGVLGRTAARMAGGSIVVHVLHGHNFYGYFGPLMSKMAVILERVTAHFTDKIIALTELEKKDLVAFKIIPPAKILVINSGLELDAYRKVNIDVRKKRDELQIEPDEDVVGMIGRLEPVKGPQHFIEAAKLVIEESVKVKFLIVGDGSLKDKLKSRCKKLNIMDKFIFTGWREDIPQLLSILNILVLPSVNEAVSRILIEAGACGVPVVATHVGGVPEIVKDNQTGILVPSSNPHRLAKAIISLLKDKKKREDMGKAAKNWVDDRFSAYRMMERISKLYIELMKNEKT